MITKCNILYYGGLVGKELEVFTVEEVAKALKLHPYTIRRLSRDKKIPAFKFGGQWRYRKDKINEWSKGGHHFEVK